MSQKLVTVFTAGSEGEARVIVAVLSAAGISAIVEGSFLMDDWAMSQRQLGVKVMVPDNHADAARAAIAAARAVGQLLDEPDDELGSEPDFSEED